MAARGGSAPALDVPCLYTCPKRLEKDCLLEEDLISDVTGLSVPFPGIVKYSRQAG